jgi:hypothetical protein
MRGSSRGRFSFPIQVSSSLVFFEADMVGSAWCHRIEKRADRLAETGQKKDAPLMCIDLTNERHGACVDLRVGSGPEAGK